MKNKILIMILIISIAAVAGLTYALTIQGNNAVKIFDVYNLRDNIVEYYVLTESTTDCSLISDDSDTLYNRWRNNAQTMQEDDVPEYQELRRFEQIVYGFDDVDVVISSENRSIIQFAIEAFDEVDALSGKRIRTIVTKNSSGNCSAVSSMNLDGQMRQITGAKIYENSGGDKCLRVTTSDGNEYNYCED